MEKSKKEYNRYSPSKLLAFYNEKDCILVNGSWIIKIDEEGLDLEINFNDWEDLPKQLDKILKGKLILENIDSLDNQIQDRLESNSLNSQNRFFEWQADIAYIEIGEIESKLVYWLRFENSEYNAIVNFENNVVRLKSHSSS